MGFNCGIVGLPNVGKSTIFNALTAAQAAAANYPFCTIEPNTGIVPVPDARLHKLAKMAKSAEIVPTTVEFVDIAGLVRGASKGEGLGNQFLGHIRSVDAIAHVVRCFEDPNVTHVDGSVSPKRDIEVIETELLLSDLNAIEKRLDRLSRAARVGDKEAKAELELSERAKDYLSRGIPLRGVEDPESFKVLDLLTSKPVVYVANVSEQDVAAEPTEKAAGHLGELVRLAHEQHTEVVVISGLVEAEIAQLKPEDRELFLADLGLKSSGLDRLATQGYSLLNLITFFTIGPKEAHAWTCRNNDTAYDAAGKIHTDFQKGFIRAEIIGYDDYVTCGGELGARDQGKLRVEGRTYIMRDGDIVHFRFNL